MSRQQHSLLKEVQDVEACFASNVCSSVPTRWERRTSKATTGGVVDGTTSAKVTPSVVCRTPGHTRQVSSSGSIVSRGNMVSTPKTGSKADRFIPNRESTRRSIGSENECPVGGSGGGGGNRGRNSQLAKSLFSTDTLNTKVLAYKQKAPLPSEGHLNNMRVIYTSNKNPKSQVKRATRHIAKSAFKVLDAPDVLNDFYLNLMDWTGPKAHHNHLAIALGPVLYLWDGDTQDIEELVELPEGTVITAVKWMPSGTHLALGTSNNEVQLWDFGARRQVRSLTGHGDRVSSLAWNQHLLAAGGRDHTIVVHDVRVKDTVVGQLKAHNGEVCGLAWSLDGKQLASGGNDNACMIWSLAQATGGVCTTPVLALTDSQAAVKALAWCPFSKNVLATGGGTADRKIRMYNTVSGSMLNEIDTGNQVSSLVWSIHEKELLSGHGFSHNNLCVWKYPSMVKLADLEGHKERVLSTCSSPNGQQVVSLGADENLRFWQVWQPRVKSIKSASTSSSSRMVTSRGIR